MMGGEFEHLQSTIIAGMRAYLADGGAAYSEADILDCSRALGEHCAAMQQVETNQQARALTRTTVLRLNELNERCGGALIETDQREQICALLIRAGARRGFNREDEDVTEQWREW
ncbi:MAG: hypothetical protein JWM10_4835 [Myxococcaceae bacterium]|nr:hypothetical protein [Myxococcaceae bacterium]